MALPPAKPVKRATFSSTQLNPRAPFLCKLVQDDANLYVYIVFAKKNKATWGMFRMEKLELNK